MVMLKPARTSMLVTTVTAEMRLEILSKNRTSFGAMWRTGRGRGCNLAQLL